MEILKEVKHELTWHNDSDGKFNVTIINGAITQLSMCEIGKSGDEKCGCCLTSIDYRFLKQVHTCLGELFEHIDSEAKKAGHSFAGEETKLTGINLLIDENAKRNVSGATDDIIQLANNKS